MGGGRWRGTVRWEVGKNGEEQEEGMRQYIPREDPFINENRSGQKGIYPRQHIPHAHREVKHMKEDVMKNLRNTLLHLPEVMLFALVYSSAQLLFVLLAFSPAQVA